MSNPKPRVLAIDNRPANLLTLKATLAPEFVLQFASSGAQGLAMAIECPPDLILIDVMMSEMDGYETCRRIKADPRLQDIPVIFVTALNEARTAASDQAPSSADVVVALPITAEITRRRIRNLLHREQLRRAAETYRKQLAMREQALLESEAFTRTILDSLTENLAVLDTQGVIVSVNRAWQCFAENNGAPALAANSVGLSYRSVCMAAAGQTGQEEALQAWAGIAAVLSKTQAQFSLEYSCDSPDQARWFRMRVYPMLAPCAGAVVAHEDITPRKRAENALREQEAFFRLIAENLQGFVAVLDIEGRRVYNSPSYARLLGDRNLCGTSSFEDIHPADRERVVRAFRETVATGIGHHLEYRFVTAGGGIRLIESRGGVIRDNEGRIKRVVVVSHDITERKAAEEKIHHLAFYDALTQLPNRLLLNDRLQQTMAASKRSACYGALMFIDLDNFKPVNDRHGHEVGDLLLIEAANRLKTCVREADTVARFGGDEFVVMLGDLHTDRIESSAQAAVVADKIRIRLSEPYLLTIRLEGRTDTTIEHHCTASIGVTLFLDHEVSRDDILKRADTGMYQAKAAGRNVIRFHDENAGTA
ncbi:MULTISPECIES: two-component system response regulator [Candidatus Accumulibacter]|jgi:diguanylate cyclase (GGDEF)-like protein/PAS domain S-box-containing protein|uniref:Cyclic di-GMP phosphodiesterase Gmr n=2 Tax=Candidatus Accumulibacter TaxID=327159 RepID=A0A080M1R7_9PROT|nr:MULTISPECIES: diguanylate cyclase [Candidatus Accumulibacter]KFB71079.1 MAG: Cyclic di-GMP phosphodiesterase Gmr [Candidatus Accumulibacter phosphatis]MBL8408169.1 diguanylate cyclase [Accumulibacter sp.]NMQ04456.1 diguanylate cyclase [Candidatus Accumulibacter contiguus]HRF10800.1 diguanylate cyclase [Candidatus Accumulibacter phosphatis]